MLQLKNKYKIYFYVFSFILLTSIINQNFFDNYKKIFSITKINIKSDSKDIENEIKLKTSYLIDKNIFNLKRDQLLKILQELNYLEQFEIRKNYPSIINIDAKKTKLVAITYKDQKKYFIGENKKFISAKEYKTYKKLPLIFGKFEVNDYFSLKSIISLSEIKKYEIIKYHFHQNKRWDVYFKNNIVIKLPNKNILQSIKILENFMKQNSIEANTTVDLRIPNRLILINE